MIGGSVFGFDSLLSYSSSQRRLTFFVFLIGIFTAVQFCFYVSPSFKRSAFEPEIDLTGRWEACAPSDGRSCLEWTPVYLPAEMPASFKKTFCGWLVYRKRFSASPSCLHDQASCVLVIGEVGDAAEVRLNGIAVGRHGNFPPEVRYAKHYPVHISLPRDLLRDGIDSNELLITVYSAKQVQAGMRRGPIGLFSGTAGFNVSQAFIATNVFMPILGAVGLFLIALITSFSALLEANRDSRLHAYVRYCFVGAVFLLSFSEVPREYLPIWIAGYLHFALRLLSDWAYFEMVKGFYGFSDGMTRCFRPLYAISILSFVLSFLSHLILGDTHDAGRGFDLAYLICRVSLPLLLLPHILGIIGAFRERTTRSGLAFAAFFSVMLVLQIHDSLIFHGYLSGTYAIKIYPLAIGVCFGWVLLRRRQKERERLLIDQQNALYAAQVAHDIRSPLAALNVIMNDVKQLPENHRLMLRQAVSRIQGIANDLVDRRRKTVRPSDSTQNNVGLLPILVDQLVLEKQAQYREQRSVRIFFEAPPCQFDLFAYFDPVDLKRVISNLIDNAVEAISSEGAVNVLIDQVGPMVRVIVKDSGVGMSSELVSRLGDPGVTRGKRSGSGLGVFHARRSVELWGGRLDIASEEGVGTEVALYLRKADVPSWFGSELVLEKDTTVVVVDDDSWIHHVWRERISAIRSGPCEVSLVHLSSPDDFRNWLDGPLARSGRNVKVLMDYEFLGYPQNGIDLIVEAGLEASAILVTSGFDNPEIQNGARMSGVKIIPKEMAASVPIVTRDVAGLVDAVLVDDDLLVRMTWSHTAKECGKRLHALNGADQVLELSRGLDLMTPIYVDQDLGADSKQSGVQVVKQLIERGFRNVYLATGHSPASIGHIPGLRAFVGKEPPWSSALTPP